MAEGLLRHDAGDRFEVESAGIEPSTIRQEAIKVMSELGIDISGHRSKSVEEFDEQRFDYVISICNSVKENCAIFLGPAKRIHRDFDNPAELKGTENERLAMFRRVRGEIRGFLTDFVQHERHEKA